MNADRVELARVRAEQQRLTDDASAERRLRVASTSSERARAERAAARAEQAEIRDEKATRRDERHKRITGLLDSVRGRAAAGWAMVVYAAAVGTAFYGQISAAVNRFGWPPLAGAGAGVVLEGFALGAALTAQSQRLEQGERALVARALTWFAAATAAAINLWGHWPWVDAAGVRHGDPAAAVVMALLSMAGITMWEIRSGARHRPALRARGLVGSPRPRLGLAFVARYPGAAWTAWSAAVADPSLTTRDSALEVGRTWQTRRREEKALDRDGQQRPIHATVELHEVPPTPPAPERPVLSTPPATGAPELTPAEPAPLVAGEGGVDSSPDAVRLWMRQQVADGRDLSEPGFTARVVAEFGIASRTAELRKREVRDVLAAELSG